MASAELSARIIDHRQRSGHCTVVLQGRYCPPKLPFSRRRVLSAALMYHLGSCEKTACAAYVRLAWLRRH